MNKELKEIDSLFDFDSYSTKSDSFQVSELKKDKFIIDDEIEEVIKRLPEYFEYLKILDDKLEKGIISNSWKKTLELYNNTGLIIGISL